MLVQGVDDVASEFDDSHIAGFTDCRDRTIIGWAE